MYNNFNKTYAIIMIVLYGACHIDICCGVWANFKLNHMAHTLTLWTNLGQLAGKWGIYICKIITFIFINKSSALWQNNVWWLYTIFKKIVHWVPLHYSVILLIMRVLQSKFLKRGIMWHKLPIPDPRSFSCKWIIFTVFTSLLFVYVH